MQVGGWLVLCHVNPLTIIVSIIYSTKIYIHNHFKQVNTLLSQASVWPIDGTLIGRTTPGQRGLRLVGYLDFMAYQPL